MKRGFGQFAISLFSVFFLSLNVCPAADKNAGSLDDYLKKLGYLPIQLERKHGNQLAVETSIKGKKHYFLVDTGGSFTLIDPEITLGVTKVDGRTTQFDDGYLRAINSTNFVAIDELKLDGIVFQNQPAFRTNIKMDYVATREKGILGCDFFARNHCIIDCTRGRLYIRAETPPESVRTALADSLRQSKFAHADLRLNFNLALTCEAKANSKATRMIVDTGGIWTTLDSNWANTNGVRAYSEGAYLSGFGEVGSHRVRAGSLDTLQIGSVTFKNVYVALTTLGAWKLGVEAQGTEDIHGILGAETLAEIGAIIDFNAGKMWFNPSNQAR